MKFSPSALLRTAKSNVSIWRGPAITGAVCTATQVVHTYANPILEYNREKILSGEWWRLATGNYVHLGWNHLALNLCGLAILTFAFPDRMSGWEWTRRQAVLVAGVGVGLLAFAPGIPSYVGFSGALYGLYTIGLGREALRGSKFSGGALALCGAYVAAQKIFGASAEEVREIGGKVISEAHICGMATGGLYVMVSHFLARRAEKSAAAEAKLPKSGKPPRDNFPDSKP